MHRYPIRPIEALGPLCLALSAFFAAPAQAWGPVGHRVVAELAYGQLSPAARQHVDALLTQEPGATLGSIASWADETRSQETYAWHYVNFPRGQCEYLPERDCPGGQCVVAQIDRQLAVLASDAEPQARLIALKYVVHFIGDIHQPLHGSFGDDRGGNTYQLQADGQGSNLHAWWDSGMIHRHGLDAAQLVDELREEGPIRHDQQAGPRDWAVEDCRIISSPGFYPEHKLAAARYQRNWWPTLDIRLRTGGARLAAALNQTLAD